MDYLIGHLIGDYLLQNDWMAQGKKRSHWPCFIHVAIYTAAVMVFTWWPWWSAIAVFVPHYLIDRWQFVPWYMRTAGQTAFMEPPMSPWSRIVVDNVMHLVCLFATANMAALFA